MEERANQVVSQPIFQWKRRRSGWCQRRQNAQADGYPIKCRTVATGITVVCRTYGYNVIKQNIKLMMVSVLIRC